MKKPMKLNSIILIFAQSLLLFISIPNCKLNLNNPADPFSKSFLETFLLNAYFDSFCDPNVRGNIRLGSGTKMIIPMSIKTLRSGKTVVTAITEEPLVWNGSANGIHSNHQNSTLNAVTFVIDRHFSKILWLDYLGEMSYGIQDWPHDPLVSVDEFSNGDLGFFVLVNGTGRSNTINDKVNNVSYYLGRYNQDTGAIVWQGYANKDNTRISISGYGLKINDRDEMVLRFTSNAGATPSSDTVGLSFPSLPTPQTASNGSVTNQTEVGIAIIRGDGVGKIQSFFPNPGNPTETVDHFVIGDKIYLFGNTSSNFVSTSGHPFVNELRSFIGIANQNLTWDSVGYFGTSASTSQTFIQYVTFGNGRFFMLGKSTNPFSNAGTLYPFEGLGLNRNYFLASSTINSTTPNWFQFLGSNTVDVPEIYPNAFAYRSTTDEFLGELLANDNGSQFTGIPSDFVSGSIQNPLGQVRAKLVPQSGLFKTLEYFNGSEAGGNNVTTLTNQTEICRGRMVKTKFLSPTFSSVTSIRSIEVSTRPASEEP